MKNLIEITKNLFIDMYYSWVENVRALFEANPLLTVVLGIYLIISFGCFFVRIFLKDYKLIPIGSMVLTILLLLALWLPVWYPQNYEDIGMYRICIPVMLGIFSMVLIVFARAIDLKEE